MNSLRRSAPGIAVALVLALVLAVLLVPSVDAQSARQQFDWLLAKRLNVDTDVAIGDDLAVTGDAAVTGNATVAGTLGVTGDATFAADMIISPGAVITVTQDLTITPTSGYQPLASAGTVGTAAIAVGTAGQLVRLVNTTNTSIVLTDTGTLKLSGNLTLGQYDSVSLISDGTNWVQLATSNN